MNVKQKIARASNILSRNLDLRDALWPDIESSMLWDRTQNVGFTTMPRPMPQIIQIIDYLAHEGKPVSRTYLSLWCRVFDESLVVIQNENEMAFEAGFSGQRSVTTWHSRMKNLVSMGFIDAKAGPKGEYQFVLIYNPYVVIKNLKEEKIPEHLSIALFSRAQEVGAADELK